MSSVASSYTGYADLTTAQAEGEDYKVLVRPIAAPSIAIIAPHGGSIEQRRKVETSGVTEKPGNEKGTAGQRMSSAHSYVDPARLRELRSVSSKKWDLTRLVRMCEELNGAFERDAFITCSMLVRSIVDHIPPIFDCKSFSEVANNYPGNKSFRGSMQHLDKSPRNHADGNLHTQIRRKESLPTRTQVAFWPDLDKLLEETIRVLEDDRAIATKISGDSDAGP